MTPQPRLPTPRRFRPYPAYKESGIEWLGEIPAHWEVKRLRSTITSCQNGVWGDDPDGVHDVVCVRVTDFDRVSLRVDITEPTLRLIQPRIASDRGLRAGDLLLEKSGGGEQQPVGVVVLYDHDVPAVCSNFVARVVVADEHDSRYLTYLHAALYAQRLNTRHIKQSTGIQNLDSASYLGEAVALPGPAEQRVIAAFLDRETARIDALVAKKGRLIELVQEKRNAVVSAVVTGKMEVVRNGGNRKDEGGSRKDEEVESAFRLQPSSVPMKDSGVEWLGEIPAHWVVTALKRIGDLQAGAGFPDDEQGVLDEEVPFFKVGDMGMPGNEREMLVHQHSVSRWTARRLRAFLFPSNTIIFAKVGAALLLNRRRLLVRSSCIDNNMMGFMPDECDPAWAMYWLSGLDMGELANPGAVPSVNEGQMRDTPAAVPPVQEQRSIAAFLDRETAKIDALIARVREAIDRLKELRIALISAAVTGKIDVSEG